MNALVTKTARVPDTNRRPSLFYSSAREAMRDFLLNAIKSTDVVLLPAYIGWSAREGSGVFDPVKDAGATAEFYDLNSDLSVDLGELEQAIRRSHPRALIVIHYFGRTDPNIEKIHSLANKHDVLLVEDLAHGFFSAAGQGTAGRHGDVSLFSLHKMFPLADGGMITYADASMLSGQVQTRPDLAAEILSYDWRAIANVRRRNFCELTSRLEKLQELGTEFELMWPTLDDLDVPQTLPVRVAGPGRDSIYSGMNADGYGMVSLYHTLIEPVRTGHENLNDLARHIINFPIHQDVQTQSLDGMVSSFQRWLTAAVRDGTTADLGGESS